MATQVGNFTGGDQSPFTSVPLGWTLYGTWRRWGSWGGVTGYTSGRMLFNTYAPGLRIISAPFKWNSSTANSRWSLQFTTGAQTGFIMIVSNVAVTLVKVTADVVGATIASVSVANTADTTFDLEYDDSTGAITVKKAGTSILTGTYTDTPNLLAGFRSYLDSVAAPFSTVTITYTPPQTIDSINGGNPITFGQPSIRVLATGFGTKPTSATATYSGGTLACTIGAGTANDFYFALQDRIDGEDWPAEGVNITYAFSNSVPETASIIAPITKKATETKVTYISAILDDPTKLTYWLDQDGFNTDGGVLMYTQPPATATMPVPNLVLSPDGNGSVFEACTFGSWFRPIADKSGFTGRAGNVYYYGWVVSESGIAPVDTTPDAGSFGTVTGAAINTVTALPDTVTISGVDPGVNIAAVPTAGTEYRVSTNGGTSYGDWTAATTNVQLGYKLQARRQSSGSYSTGVLATVTVGGTAFSGTITTMAMPNLAPVITSVKAVTLTAQITATDPNGDTLSYSVTTQGAYGTASVNSSGLITYTAGVSFAGKDKFVVTVSDGNGGTATVRANISKGASNNGSFAIGIGFGI